MRTALDYLLFTRDGRKKPPIQYEADLRRLPLSLVNTFCLFHADGETTRWLESARNPSVWRGVLGELVRPFLSRTTANGLAGRGGMFVLSRAQFVKLLDGIQLPSAVTLFSCDVADARESSAAKTSSLSSSPQPVADMMLDIGAGDGGVTAVMAPFFRSVCATEDSLTMRWRLSRRGFCVLPVNQPFATCTYDFVSCLNVLDRADTPWSLLRNIHASLKPGGIALLAVVLPWCPFVEDGAAQRRPTEMLPMTGGECCKGATFEASLDKLVHNVLQPAGFEVVRWSKLPYLSEGSPTHEYYRLYDAVFVLRHATAKAIQQDVASTGTTGH